MPATLTSPNPKSVYETSGKNWAPLDGLKGAATNKVDRATNSLTEALQKKYNEYKARDYQAFVENCKVGEQVANLQTGKMLLMRSIRTGQYMFVKREGLFSDNKTVSGKFQFYWTKLEAEWFSSRPELDPVIPSEDDQVEEFIANVKIIQDHYSKKFYNIDYEKQEFASAAGFGTYISRYRYDPYLKDIVCEILPFPACRWDIRFSPEESGHFIYESKAKNAVLESLLGADLAEDGDDTYNYGLQIIDRLARTGGNTAGNGKERPYGTYDPVQNESTVIEMWLSPEEYCDIKLDQDTKTVSGGTIPRDTPLTEVFPKGMVVVGLNQMNLIWAIHDECHKDHIVSGVYHAQIFSGVGKGISDAVDAMKDLNDLHSQLLAHIKTHATPGYGYIEGAVSEDMARDIGKPRKNIPFNIDRFPEGIRDIRQVMMPLTPSDPAQAAFEYETRLENDLQMSMQVTEFSSSPVLGINSHTATGDKIRDENAATVLVPQHLRKADSRRRGAIVTFNLFKKYIDAPKWFATKAKNAITAGKYLTGTQFDGIDVDYEIVSNSEIPRSPLQQQDAISRILQYTAGIGGLLEAAQVNPEITGEIVTAFGAKLSIPNKNDTARICRRRIEQAKKILEAEMQKQRIMSGMTGVPFNNVNLPAIVVAHITPQISPFEMYATQKAEWMSELLDSDELQDADPMLRYVVEEMIGRQLQTATFGEAERAQDQNLAAVIANLPMVLGEQAMSDQAQSVTQEYERQQLQAQNQQAIQDNQMALENKKQEALISERSSDADHQRVLAQNSQAHAHAIQLKGIEHLSKMEQVHAARKSQAKTA